MIGFKFSCSHPPVYSLASVSLVNLEQGEFLEDFKLYNTHDN